MTLQMSNPLYKRQGPPIKEAHTPDTSGRWRCIPDIRTLACAMAITGMRQG